MSIDSLLPRGATRFEQAIERTISRDVPVGLAVLNDPEKAPASFVPFLAWGLSTDLWDRDWPIEKKRAVAKAWLRLHRKKGTLAGIEEAVRFFDARVLAARHPPDAFYPDPALTREERDAYLTRFQQVRFYRFRNRGATHFGAYVGQGFKLPGLFAGRKFFPTFTDAAVRIGRRAFLYDPLTGIEEPVKRAERVTTTETGTAVQFEEVALPGKARHAFFAGRSRARLFPIDTEAAKRVYSVSILKEYSERRSSLHISGVLPSVQPIDVRPRRTRLPGQIRAGQLFPGRPGRSSGFMVGRFLPRSSASLRIFEQVFLFDPSRMPDKRGARTFVGHFRLGMPPYHARLVIEARGKRSPFAFGRFVSGYLLKTDKKKLRQTIEAVRQSKALRDKITVKTRTMRRITVADAPRVGTISVGAFVRDL